jgi:hypothetical protein
MSPAAALATQISLCRTLVDMMVQTLREGPAETRGEVFLPFSLHVPENSWRLCGAMTE